MNLESRVRRLELLNKSFLALAISAVLMGAMMKEGPLEVVSAKKFLLVDDQNQTKGTWGVSDGNPLLGMFGKKENSAVALGFRDESEAKLVVRASPDVVCQLSAGLEKAECQVICDDKILDSVANKSDSSLLMTDGVNGTQIKILSSPKESTFTILEKSKVIRFIVGLFGNEQSPIGGLYDQKQNLIWDARSPKK